MSIVSSNFTVGVAQRDGRKYVTEVHTDNVGIPHIVEYLAMANADFTAIMNARAIIIAAQLINDEIDATLAADNAPALKYATLVQLGAVFRQRYQALSGLELAKLARWIIKRVQEGTFTDAQVRNFFNLTVTQYNALKTKWQTMKSEYDDLNTAVGE